MQNRIFASLILMIAICGCATNGNKSHAVDSSLAADSSNMSTANSLPSSENIDTAPLKGRWNLIPAMASDTAAGKIPYLVFDTGRVSGNTGCNSFSGSYRSSGVNLSFDEKMITTRMACPGYDETAFVKSLLRTTGFDIKGDTLVLKADVTPLSYWLKGK